MSSVAGELISRFSGLVELQVKVNGSCIKIHCPRCLKYGTRDNLRVTHQHDIGVLNIHYNAHHWT